MIGFKQTAGAGPVGANADIGVTGTGDNGTGVTGTGDNGTGVTGTGDNGTGDIDVGDNGAGRTGAFSDWDLVTGHRANRRRTAGDQVGRVGGSRQVRSMHAQTRLPALPHSGSGISKDNAFPLGFKIRDRHHHPTVLRHGDGKIRRPQCECKGNYMWI